jgi:RNA polymerase primary sigma factor
VHIARQFMNRGLDLPDLVAEGNLGLIKGVERFDPGRGVRFSTFASWWIRQSIQRALLQYARLIRLPARMHHQLSRMERTSRRMASDLGREPDARELASELGITEKRLSAWKRAPTIAYGLEASGNGEDGLAPIDTLPDESATLPDQECSSRQMTEWVRSLMHRLDGRTQSVLHWRFGLDGGGERSLKEIGAQLHITKERVRQIEAAGLSYLREHFGNS